MLIQKYLRGELSAAAMHELERRALDDPFLMDAMTGFEQHRADQQGNPDEPALRPGQRREGDRRRVIPWGPVSIIAAMLVLLGAGAWFFSTPPPPLKTAQITRSDTDKRHTQPTISSPSALPVAAAGPTPESNARPAGPRPYSVQATRKKSIDTATALALAAKEALAAPVADEPVPAASPELMDMLYKPRKDSASASEMIVSGMGHRSSPADKDLAAKKYVPSQVLSENPADGIEQTPGNRIVSGTVIGPDGAPILGATVKISGRSFGTITNAAGKFSLADVSRDQTLSVNYIGYPAKKVKLADQDSLTIHLEPASGALSEVVVGASPQDNASPHPRQGWAGYNAYLEKNAVSPDGATGSAVVTLIVAADGKLGRIKVSQSLSAAADSKAIDLVKNGPLWQGASNGKPEEIKLNIPFHR